MAEGDKTTATFAEFSGMRNTVTRERMGPKELAQATNVDLDDAGQLHRRRGSRKVLIGRCHSLFEIDSRRALVVMNDVLCLLLADYSTVPLMPGIGPASLDYEALDLEIYFSSPYNSGIVDLTNLQVVKPWGLVTDPKYQPGVRVERTEWWYSPVSNPDTDLGPVAGRLLAPPPLAQHIASNNGRMYLAAGSELWATLLYNFMWVDRNSGYRQYESYITGIVSVTDGIYVGTEAALYFVSGSFGAEKRKVCEKGGVIDGTMTYAPGEILNPQGRTRPDLPQQTSSAMICMTTEGVIVGLDGGETFNLTRTNFKFPEAVRGASIFKDMDGMAQVITTLDSAGTPTVMARASDYCDATIIRAADRRPAPDTLSSQADYPSKDD